MIVTVSVCVTVLVLTLVGGVVLVGAVVVGAVVVGVVVVGWVVVSVSVSVMVTGGTTVATRVEVNGVSEVVGVVSEIEPPVMALARPKTTSPMSTAPTAPNATRATGWRCQGVSPGGGVVSEKLFGSSGVS